MRKQYRKWAIGTVVAGAALALVDALFFERYFFKVKFFEIGKKKSNSPPIRIIHLTDLHVKKALDWKHQRLVNRIKALEPDLLLLTGDSLDEHGNVDVLDRFLELHGTTTPIAAILGNHDHKAEASVSQIRGIYQKHGVDLLINASKAYQLKGNRVMVTGMDDFIEGQSDFTKAVENISKEENHLALIHSPLQQEKLLKAIEDHNASRNEDEKLNIQYIFSGHNHGGQVTFFGMLIPYLPEMSGDYIKGWYNKQKPYLYVSKGFGTSAIPFRFGARAEITFFYYYP